MNDPRLVGVWSADIMYGPGAQSDTVFIFKADGTGWMESWNFMLTSAEFFHWEVPEPERLILRGCRALELDDTDQIMVDIKPLWDKADTPFSIRVEETPSGNVMPVLRVKLFPQFRDAWNTYGLDEQGVLAVNEPKAGPA